MPAYKDDKGKWYVSFYYTTWEGERKRKKKEGFEKKKDALDYERDFIKQASTSNDMLFSSLTKIYLDDCKTRLKLSSMRSKENVIYNHILPQLGELSINEITPAKIRQWQNNLINNGNEYSQTYLKMVNVNLSGIFNFAVKYYGLTRNPVSVCGSIGSNKADTMQFWTVDEFKQFITVFDNDILYKTIFELLFWTGMRIGELLALTGNDFDFDNKTININKNYVRIKKEDIIQEPKTKKSKRVIDIPSFLCELVSKYISHLYDYDEKNRLFDINKQKTNYYLNKGCDKTGVKRIRIHDLRHSHASLLIELGYQPLLIAERLGHEDIRTTLQTYSHLYPNKQEKLVSELEKVRF